MGSSSKKRKEKKKDFHKPKLRVGKAKAKPENYTDTSFQSKSIVLNQQSLRLSAPSSNTQFSHHVSLLSAKSDTQRRESLAHLTTAIVSRPVDSPLPQPVSVILPSLLPLILDTSNNVRAQLLKLLRALPSTDVEDHIPQLLPYVRAGMTHLAADIRVSAVEVLSWLVDVAGPEVVSCAGGWIKTMNCFLSVLGWHTEESSKWSANRASFGKSGTQGKPMIKVLTALGEFMHAGIGKPDDVDDDDDDDDNSSMNSDSSSDETLPAWAFPLCQTEQHMIPTTAVPYAYLNLFGQPRDEEGEMYETREDRYRVFANRFLQAVERGLETTRKEGGEVGRASTTAGKVLREAVAYGPGA